MGNKFDKLIAAVNVIAYGKPTVKPGKFLLDCEKDSRASVGDEINRQVFGASVRIERKVCCSLQN